jgi:hypothetical protein
MSYHDAGLNPIVDGANVTGAWMEYVEDSIEDIEASLAEPKPSGKFDYKVLRTGSYYEAYDANGILKYGGEDDEGSVSGSNAAAVINKCLTDLAAASGGVLYIEKAQYVINEQIVIPATITTNPGERAYIEITSPRAVFNIDENLASNAITLTASTAHYSLKIRGLSIFCNSKSASYYALYIANAMYIFLEDFEAGWEGIKIYDTDTIFINNLYCVDCAGEGLNLDNVGYCFASDFFIDNCGGWGEISGYNAILLKESTRVYFTNFNVFGEKGVYGGQEYGIYMDTVGFSHFSNFQIDGFKKSSIKCDQCKRLTFTNFELIDADEHPFTFTSNTDYATEDITISNFNIYVSNNQDALGFYAQNSKDISNVLISNGLISGVGDGIVIGNGDGLAKCYHISVDNVNIEVSGYAISESGLSDHNMFSNINARSSTSGIYTTGSHSKVTNSWVNFTTFVYGEETLPFTVGAGGVSANDIVAVQADNTIYKAKFTTNGEKVVGVAQSTGSEGATVYVRVSGTATVVADSSLNAGDRIAASDSTAGRGVEWNSHAHTYGTLSTGSSGAHVHTTTVDGEHQHGAGTYAGSGNNDLEHLHSLYVASTPFDGNTNNGLGTKTITVAISGSAGAAGDHYHATDQSQNHTHSVSGNTGSLNNGYVIGKALTGAAGAGSTFKMLIVHGT